MQIVILCGGLAVRLYPLTKKIPKSMIEIAGKPFLERQIELLKKNKISNIVLCIGYKGGQIKKYFGNGKKFGVNIQYSQDGKKLLGTAGAIKKTKNILEESFMVMYGDSYLPFNFQAAIKFFERSNKLGLMTVYKNCGRYEKSNVVIGGNLVAQYSKEKRTQKMKYIDYGISILRKEALKFVPKNEFYDLADLLKFLIKKNQLLAFDSKTRFYEIGSPHGLKEFQEYGKLI